MKGLSGEGGREQAMLWEIGWRVFFGDYVLHVRAVELGGNNSKDCNL